MTKKHILLFLCTGFIFQFFNFQTAGAQTPSWNWAIRSGGNKEEAGMQVVTDSAGNVYGWGIFNSASIQFGSQTLVNQINPGNQSDAYYVVKYSATGNAQWAKTYPGYLSAVNGITLDPSGNLYVFGQFNTTLTVEGTTITHNGISQQQCIMKYTPAGQLVWAKRIGGIRSQSRTRIFRMEALDENHLVAWGDAYNDTLGNIPLDYTQWLGKLDTSGQFGTVKSLGGNSGPDPMSLIETSGITVGKNHAVYLYGTDVKNAFINTANWQLDTAAGEGIDKAFIARFDQNLDFVWSKMIYTDLSSYGMSTATKAAVDHQDNIYLLGHAQSAAIWFDPARVRSTTPKSIFLVKYAPDGNVLRDTVMAHPITPPITLYRSISTDKVGNLYYMSNFYGPYSFGDTSITADGGSNLFVTKFNAAGQRLWIQRNTLGAMVFPRDMTEDGRGNLYLTGRFAYSTTGVGTAGFGNTVLNAALPLPGAPVADLFIAKLGNCQASPAHITPQNAQTLCPGDSIVLTASGAQEYVWTTGATTPALTVTQAGTYGVSGVAPSGCYGSSATVNVTTATVDVGVTSVQSTLTAHAGNAVYQWAVCHNNALQVIPGATSQSYTAPQAGSYAVIVTQGGCTDTSACHALVLGSGIDAAAINRPEITLFPNPNTGDFSVDVAGGEDLVVTMTVWDVSGKKQLEEKLTGPASSVQAGRLPPGMYQVRFTLNGTCVKSSKMIVVK